MAAMELVVVVVVSMVAARPGRGFAREKESSSRRSSTRSKEGEKRKKERRKEKKGEKKWRREGGIRVLNEVFEEDVRSSPTRRRYFKLSSRKDPP